MLYYLHEPITYSHRRSRRGRLDWGVILVGAATVVVVGLTLLVAARGDEPRPFNAWQLAGLAAISGLIISVLVWALAQSRQRKGDECSDAQERYRAFIQNSSEAIWRYEIERPLPIDLPEDEQIDWMYRYGYLAECNEAMVRMYGFDSHTDLLQIRLDQILPRSQPRNIEMLRAFIRSNYRLVDAESEDMDRHGNLLCALNTFYGVIENGYGVRVWGCNRDISRERLREREAMWRQQQQAALAELSQLGVTKRDVSVIFERAVQLVKVTLEVDCVTVSEVQDDSELIVRAATGWRKSPIGRTIDADSIYALRRNQPRADLPNTLEPVIVTDVAAEFKSSVEIPLTSGMSVTIFGDQTPFGVLAVHSEPFRAFDLEEIRFVQAVANTLASVAIRTRADESLRASRELYQMLVGQVKDYAIFMVDPQGRPTSWNEGVKRVLGYGKQEFIGMPLRLLFTPEDIERGVPARELETAERESQAHHDRWMIRKDGTPYWSSGITAALRDRHGRLLGFTVVMRDLTERRQTEIKLLKSEASLAAAQRIAHVGNWELELDDSQNLDFAVLRWSDEVYRIFGYEPNQVPVNNELFFQHVHPDDRQEIREAVRSALQTKGRYSLEYRIIRTDGQERIVQEQAEIVRDQERQPRQLIGTIQDITERKHAELELADYREHLEHLVYKRTADLEESHRRLRFSERMAALGTLSAGLGHDMGNLLLPIRIRLDSLESREAPREAREDIRVVRVAADYLQRLANGLRLLAIDPDRPPGTIEHTDLISWWRDAEPILKNALPRGTQLAHEFPEGLPRVQLARHHLMQAVFNLVQNAGDSLRGRSDGRVRVWATQADDGRIVQLGVTDNGPGMTDEVKRRCLEPFFTTKTRGISTGLGLALVHGIAQKAGATLDIHSEPGHGATFILGLIADTPGAAPTTEGHPHRAILSINDLRLRSYITSLLEALEFQVAIGDGRTIDSETSLWVTDRRPGLTALAHEFLDADPHRHMVLIGISPDEMPLDRAVYVSQNPKPALLRKAFNEIASAHARMTSRIGV